MSITSQSHFPEGSEGAMKLLNCCSKVLLPGVYLVLHIVSSVFPSLVSGDRTWPTFCYQTISPENTVRNTVSIWTSSNPDPILAPTSLPLLSIHPHRAPWSDWGSTSQQKKHMEVSMNGLRHQPSYLVMLNGKEKEWEMFKTWYTGWWLSPTPLKNICVRQLGWWNSQY